MEHSFLQEVKNAVEISLKGDKESVTTSNNLLGEVLPTKPGYLPALLAVSVDNTNELSVRKAAAIILGKEIKFNWKKIAENGRVYSENDKDIIRREFFEGMVRSNDQSIIRLLGHALYSIILKEIDSWTTFDDSIYQVMVQNPTKERIYCALVSLHSLAKVKQYYIDEDREKVSATSNRFLPILLELGNTLSKEFDLSNALLVKEILKIFFRFIRIDLDTYLRTFEVNDGWMDFINQAFTHSILSLRRMVESKTSDTIYLDNPYWNCMKWILRIFKRYTFVYGEPDKEKDDVNKPFANHWMNKYSVPLWELLIEVLNNRKMIRMPAKVLKELITCLQYLLDSEAVLNKHSVNLETFLFESVFDLVRFTKEDQELFEDNPVEYFRINDENNHDYSVGGHALNIYGKVFKDKVHLKSFMKFVGKCLADKVNPKTNQPVTVIDIEAFFHIIETHSTAVLRIKNISDIITGLLTNFVAPELTSEHGFMRMRACKMVTIYGSSTLGADILKNLSDGVIKCLNDKELPVRSCAAQALETLLKKQELRDFFLPNLQEILKVYLALVNEFENETLIGSLKGIFEMYSEVIGPYAIDLTKSLVDLFFKCVEKEKKAEEASDDASKNDKDLMESGFACQSTLSSIEEVLRSTIDKSILPTLYTLVEPILEVGFSDECLDYLSEIAGILNTFIYNFEVLPDGLWSWFVIVCYSVNGRPNDKKPDFPPWVHDECKKIFNELPIDDFASEFFLDLNQIIRNFVNKGSPFLFEQRDFYGIRLFDLLCNYLIEVIRKNLPHEYQYDDIACSLSTVGFTLAQLPGKLDAEIPKLMDISIDALKSKYIQLVKECFVHNLGYSLWNNTTVTLEYLNSKGLLADVLTNWPDHHKKTSTYRIRKGSFLGMLSLFSLSTDQLTIAQIPILDFYKVMVETLPILARDQEKILNEDFDDSDFDGDIYGIGSEDEDELAIDLDEPDLPESHKGKNTKQYKKLDDRISKTRKKIEEMDEKGEIEREQAKEALYEIDGKIFNDNADKMNEVLLFETTMQNLQTSNPTLFQEISKVTTAEMNQNINESITKVKTQIDSK